jgi:hypothetical protein
MFATIWSGEEAECVDGMERDCRRVITSGLSLMRRGAKAVWSKMSVNFDALIGGCLRMLFMDCREETKKRKQKDVMF